MWRAELDGLRLRFHLAGINNQNFLMRDEATGSYWQQITGAAISGPLAGRRLEPVASDELTFALWKMEEPRGTVLKDDAAFVAEYAPRNWDVQMAKEPTVLSFREHGRAPRDLMIGVSAFGASRAFLYDDVLKQKLVQDRVGSEPVIVVVGADEQSVRVFRKRIPGIAAEPVFYRLELGVVTANSGLLMDTATGSRWNFQGCAVSGKAQGTCLERVEAIKDYWFDWRNYHPGTTVWAQH